MTSFHLTKLDRFELTFLEKMLLRLFILGSSSGLNVSDLFRNLDLGSQSQDFLLVLASLGMRTGWKGFPKSSIPRLKGIHKFLQTRALLDIPWFSTNLIKLTDAGIDVLLLKGIALQAYFAPNLVRNRTDLDVLVKERDYETANEVLTSSDTVVFSNYLHHSQVFSRDSKNCLELHRWAFRGHNDALFDVWKSAKKIDCFSTSAYIFDPYTMIVHLCDTKAYNLATNCQMKRKLQPLLDIVSITKSIKNFNLDSLAWRSEELGAICPTEFIFLTLAEVLPELFNPLDTESAFALNSDYDEWLSLLSATNDVVRKYEKNNYKEGEDITFSRALHVLKKDRAEYKYLDWVFRYSEPRLSFYKYLLVSRGISSIKEYSDFREVKKRFATFINR